MIRRVPICLCATVLVAAGASPLAARPVRKAPARRPAAASAPHEVLADGVCRYSVSMEGAPLDEARFLFHSVDLALPRSGGVLPVVSERDYRQDLPEGAPEFERRVYAHEVMHFDVSPENAVTGDTGLKQWSRARLMPGLPPGPETRVLGLPWISCPTPRAGLTWLRTEALDFPHVRGRFRYRVAGLTTVGGQRAWRVERSLDGDAKTLRPVKELNAPAQALQWEETFWLDAAGREMLRMERRLRLATRDAKPTELKLEVDWVRKGIRPVATAEYRARVSFFDQLAQVERQVMDAVGRTTLDGASDLRELQQKLAGLREDHPQPRYQLTFEKLDTAIEQGLQSFRQRENTPPKPG
jgi:hypothetical protein